MSNFNRTEKAKKKIMDLGLENILFDGKSCRINENVLAVVSSMPFPFEGGEERVFVDFYVGKSKNLDRFDELTESRDAFERIHIQWVSDQTNKSNSDRLVEAQNHLVHLYAQSR